MNTFHIIPQYQESVDGLLIPQFFQVIPQSLFTDGDKVLLSKQMLADGFTWCSRMRKICLTER